MRIIQHFLCGFKANRNGVYSDGRDLRVDGIRIAYAETYPSGKRTVYLLKDAITSSRLSICCRSLSREAARLGVDVQVIDRGETQW